MVVFSDDELQFIKTQDGLHHESIAVALPKVQARLLMLHSLKEDGKIDKMREFTHLRGKSAAYKVAVATSAYNKAITLMNNRECKLDKMNVILK